MKTKRAAGLKRNSSSNLTASALTPLRAWYICVYLCICIYVYIYILCIYAYKLSHSVWRREHEIHCTRGIHICMHSNVYLYICVYMYIVYICVQIFSFSLTAWALSLLHAWYTDMYCEYMYIWIHACTYVFCIYVYVYIFCTCVYRFSHWIWLREL